MTDPQPSNEAESTPNLPVPVTPSTPLKPRRKRRDEIRLNFEQILFAEWFIDNQYTTSLKEQVEKFEELTQRSVEAVTIKRLRKLPAFKAYLAELSGTAVARARKMLERRLPYIVHLHHDAMQQIKEPADVAKFTVPSMSLLLKNDESAKVATQIVINVSEKQQALLGTIAESE